MARKYSITTGLTSIAASTTKVACLLVTGTNVTSTVIGFDITFDSTATGATAIPIRVELVRVTAASSGGAAFTPSKWYSPDAASTSTARINDTSDGTSPLILKSWLVSPTSGLAYQFPLGREFNLTVSDFLELRLITQAGMTTCNYEANLDFEE